MPKRKRGGQDGLYQRPDSENWWVSFTNASGERIRRSCGTTDRKEAEAILAKLRVEAHQVRHWDAAPSRTFEELMVGYLRARRHKRSAATDLFRARALREHLGGAVMQEISPARLRVYIEARRDEGVTDSTINREMALLSAAINYANTEWEWALPNPVRGRLLAEPEGRVRWISREEANRLLDAAKKALRVPFLAEFIALGLYTGCRKEELLGLEWSRVDLRENLIHLEAQHTKAGRRRSVPLCQGAREALLRQASFRAQKCPAAPWVFVKSNGQRVVDIRDAFARACRDAGITDFRPHDLRHTCAAWLVTDGAPLAEIRDLLGHSTIMMTERYAHLAPENLRSTVARFDASRLRHGAAGELGQPPQKTGVTP